MRTIYCIPKLDQIDKYMNFSKEYNAAFEYNDFFIPAILDQPEKVAAIIEQYKSLDRDRSEDTLHGVFLDICIHSADPLVYKASDYRIRQSMDIAMELGCKAVIFHTNQIPNFRLQTYLDGWVDLNEKYWRGLLADYPKLEIYMENMFDMESDLLVSLAERMQDEPRFGVCLDIAHAFISSEPIENWCRVLKPYIRHLHINDNNGVEDTHNPVGQKDIPWEKYNEYIQSLDSDGALGQENESIKKPTVLIEVRDYEALTESVRYMKEKNIYPF